jgi:hypothetical protein
MAKARARGRLWKIVKRLVLAGLIVLVLLLAPVAYIELGCRGDSRPDTYKPLITDAAFQRKEANTYLTYPEWHIVYAYDGLAEVLKTGDEHAFGYASSVANFWRSTCGLMRAADEHGGADTDTRVMIHTIGVSFTVEMAAKAAYEETFGRFFAWVRGTEKTPQDRAVLAMAVDYSAFLRQNPWYQYSFERETRRLWDVPIDGFVRGWERRFAIGFEFTMKRVYAGLIGSAAAAAPAQLVIRTVVSGIDAATLAKIPNVTIVAPVAGGFVIQTPRYDLFTRTLVEVARRNGTVREIAGNDDIMVTVTVPRGTDWRLPQGRVIRRLAREGFQTDRLLLDLKVSDLSSVIKSQPLGDPGLEHVFDY